MSSNAPRAPLTPQSEIKDSRTDVIDWLKSTAFGQIDMQFADSDVNKNDSSNIRHRLGKAPKTLTQFQQRIKKKISEHLESQGTEGLLHTQAEERLIYHRISEDTANCSAQSDFLEIAGEDLLKTARFEVFLTTQGQTREPWQVVTQVSCSVSNTPLLFPFSSTLIGTFQGTSPDVTGVKWE